MKFCVGLVASALSVFAASNSAALAAEPLTVQVDKTQLLTISEDPGTVVVGNPSMADVTINGRQVFVHGRAFGDTNLIILDKSGRQIANFDLTVAYNTANAVALYKGGAAGPYRTSYTCAPLCEVTMQVGDPAPYTQMIISANQAKSTYATSQAAPASAAAKPAQ